MGCLATLIAALAFGDDDSARKNLDARTIQFPDAKDYKTLVLDPHTHSVFSDGNVWPTIRIEEALKDGLDAMAVTEHLEYQPHLVDIPHPNRNRSYEIASDAAKESDLIVISGAEITRNFPYGHMNALFLNDANALFKVPEAPATEQPFDAMEYWNKAGEWPAQNAVEAANHQGAFVFWNHPFSLDQFPNSIPEMTDFHRNLVKKGLLHGIEVANYWYSEEAFQIALDYNLTLIGSSDIHGLIDWEFETNKGGHRSVTLVFVKEKSKDAIKEALFDRRTVAWLGNVLIGRPQHLGPLLEASLGISRVEYRLKELLSVFIHNQSDADFRLMNKSPYSFHNGDLVEVPAHETVEIYVKTGEKVKQIELTFEVLNALVAPKQPAEITLKAAIAE